jgi:zinc transport system permease protein
MPEFLIRAALAGLGVAVAAGPLGALILWRRMVYFGDATAHAAILGVALALMADLPVALGAGLVALAVAALAVRLTTRGRGMETALGVLSHGALAAGLVAVALLPGVRVDLNALLFGDILAVTRGDLLVIWGGAIAVLALLAWRWGRLVTATLSEDLAAAEGIDPARERMILTLALALVVAVALKVVGALLITAMLIIPAAAARGLSRTPEGMAVRAAAVGAMAALGGLALSMAADTPAGPSIVVAAVVAFGLSLALGARRPRPQPRP